MDLTVWLDFRRVREFSAFDLHFARWTIGNLSTRKLLARECLPKFFPRLTPGVSKHGILNESSGVPTFKRKTYKRKVIKDETWEFFGFSCSCKHWIFTRQVPKIKRCRHGNVATTTWTCCTRTFVCPTSWEENFRLLSNARRSTSSIRRRSTKTAIT